MYKLSKTKKILLIFFLVIIFFKIFFPLFEKIIYFNMTVNDIHSNFNVRIDRKNYKVVDDGKKCYKLEHKKIEKLRSEYVSIYSPINSEENYLNYYLSSTGFSDETEKFYLRKGGKELFYLIKHYGFGKYFVNEFIYDKTKGNNFEEIEKIFRKYKAEYKDTIVNYLVFTEPDIAGAGGILNVNANPNNKDKRLEYQNKFTSYFSVERKFEEIDWYEFKKATDIKPALTYFINLNKEDLEKVFEEIKPYYNREEFVIVLLGKDGDSIW